MKKKVIIVLSILISLIVFSNILGHGWIIYREGAFKGRVIDSETKEPIEGAVVAALYHVREYSLIESNSITADVKEVLTDKNGNFYIPPHLFVKFYCLLLAAKETTEFLIYKPSYAPARGPAYVRLPSGYLEPPDLSMIAEAFKKGATVKLVKLTTAEKRKQATLTADIFGVEIKRGSLPFLYGMINEEHKKGF
jgi:hypothetical protein